MSRFLSASDPQLAASIQRWLPPDVDFDPAAVVVVEPEGPPPPTAEEISALVEAAQREGAEAGYREGYETGYREGREKAEQEAATERAEREDREREWRQREEQTLRETVAALERIARALADPLADSADALEPELLALVSALARRVVMAELITRPELIQQVLHEALQQLPSRKHSVRIHVNPRDQPLLAAYAESNGENLSWIADPEVEAGGCRLISGPSRIDASLEARLRQGIDAIWGELELPEPSDRSSQADERGSSTDPESSSDMEPQIAPEPESAEPAAQTAFTSEPEPASESESDSESDSESETGVPPT